MADVEYGEDRMEIYSRFGEAYTDELPYRECESVFKPEQGYRLILGRAQYVINKASFPYGDDTDEVLTMDDRVISLRPPRRLWP
jgi:hypothetical protein